MPILEEGQVFERYFIIRWLGSGVSGESYEAKDVMLQQKVTLKLIHPWSLLPDSARRQFFREMQGISRLNHPYLASVLDYGENNGKLYVARRYTSSGSLLGNEGRMWFRPPLNIPDAIRYTHQLAQALEYIHSQGNLHGALTFSNVLVLRGPNVENDPHHEPFLLADVGLANFVRRFGQTQAPPLPITAAPEQLGKRVTPASDQFALAALLFSWLAARPPYLGSPEEIEHQKLTETIASLCALNTKVTSEQEAIVRRALTVYSDERYPSIMAFARALLATIAFQTQSGIRSESLPQPALRSSNVQLGSDIQLEPGLTSEAIDVPLPSEEAATAQQDSIQPEPESAPEPLAAAESTPPTSAISMPIPEIVPTPGLARFIITSPYAEGSQEVVLEREEIAIGRAGSSDILLEHDTQTSRHHALLKREYDHYIIYDRRSISGVFVNGQKLADNTGQILVDGDRVRIGNYEVIFRAGTPSPIN
jgi:serine/threonine protein kinase